MGDKEQAYKRPDIFTFHHYRSFLIAWFEYLKKAHSLSLRKLAQKSNLSCAYLPLFIAGKRKMSASALSSIVAHLKLNSQERRCLELMRTAAEGISLRSRIRALERIQRFLPYKQLNPAEARTFAYLTHWYFVAIHELAQAKDFRLDALWIQARLRERVPLNEITKALDFLSKEGFFEVAEGKVRVIERDIQCAGEVLSLALRQFHYEIGKVAMNSLDDSPKEQHHILGHTLCLSLDKLKELETIIREALNKIELLGKQSSPATSVFHVNLLFAPLTRTTTE